MELDIWQGDWGLPSVDLTCLQVLAYAKFSGAPIKVNKTNWPLSRHGQLPIFRHGPKVTLSSFDDIVAHLQKNNYSADSDLSPEQVADTISYTALLRDKLYPSLLHTWWVNVRNYIKLTRPWYAKVLAFPLNYFLPGRQKWRAEKTINALCPGENSEVEIMEDARECLNLLTHRLGENNYFFGESPSTLDAIVFGFLAPLYKAPFPNATVQNYLKGCDSLTKFVSRILRQYFPLSQEEAEELKRREASEREEKQEFPNKWRDIILSASFAGGLMLLYCISNRRVRFPRLRFYD